MIYPSAKENLKKRIFGLVGVALVVGVVEGVGIFESLLVEEIHWAKSVNKCCSMTDKDMRINPH